MQHLDEGTIHGWLDGALSPDEAARVEAHVGSCTACADAVAEARGLIAASSRILTALDDVPSVRVSPGARHSRSSLTTWLVRERIAAVMTLVVAGGALALVLARNTPEAKQVDLAAVPVALEIAAVDSPAPPPVAAMPLEERQTVPTGARVRAAPPSRSTGRGVVSNREGDSAPAASLLQQSPTVVAEAAPAPAARTDDSVSVTVAAAQRAEARESSAQAAGSVAEKAVGDLTRRRAVDASARYARPAAPVVGGVGGVAALADGPRLLQEEKMTEEGREVRRRIYSVDGVLVTLDERQPVGADLEVRARIANVPPADSAAVGTTIRWTDAKGTEFTLAGAAPRERLEQIRKLLGY